MNDDDTDSGGDFFVDALKTIIGVIFVVLVVATVGAVVWEVL
jgi:hypothetical protein